MSPAGRRRWLQAMAGVLALRIAGQAAGSPVPATMPPELAAGLPGARRQSQATLRWLGLRVYDIALWTGPVPVDAGNWATLPLALELRYARTLAGAQIAERSIEEMRRQAPSTTGQRERWLEAMSRLFPDVRDGDRLTGVQQPGAHARFFFNGALRGEVADPLFTQLFFGIWLSGQTSEPALREQLLRRGP